jgi:hypothetical protein
MPNTVPSITTLKTPTTIIKKALIIGAAAAGLIAVGAVAFVVAKPAADGLVDVVTDAVS